MIDVLINPEFIRNAKNMQQANISVYDISEYDRIKHRNIIEQNK
tara:strand:- start:123 stop:254 length:132 start_codon:yes stop_codon:yes gene_type:complete